MVEQGVPIAEKSGSNVTVTLTYGNHKSVAPFADKVRYRIYDVWLGRTVVFPRMADESIPGLRLFPV